MAQLTKNEKDSLLQFARKNISWKLGLEDKEPAAVLIDKQFGAFVTLRKDGNLRGCIGQIIAEKPLSETIGEMSEAAAFRDPRFTALTADEMSKISIEISILSPLEKVVNMAKIKPGRDGLYVKNGFYSGLLLPQVATEQNWNRDTFINQTFQKAGLSPDLRDDENTEIFSFTAEVFSEKDNQ